MSLVSGVVQAGASKSAANTQASAATESAATQAQAITEAARISAKTQMDMFEMGQEATEPWRIKGAEALDTLSNKIAEGPYGIDGEFDYEKSPGYDFRMAEGEKALERSAAARGGLFSGAQGKAMERFGQNYATGDYDRQKANTLREYYESLTPLQSLAGVGQSTASQTAGAAQATGNSIANTQMAGGMGAAGAIASGSMNAANAQAAGQINQSNAISGAMQSGTSNALAGYDLWKTYGAAGAAGAGLTTIGSSGVFNPASLAI